LPYGEKGNGARNRKPGNLLFDKRRGELPVKADPNIKMI